MDGTTLQRSLRAMGHALRSPGDALRWITYSRSTAIESRLPWVSWPAIRFFRKSLASGDVVLEWGAGGSTLFFLDNGCRVTTIESSSEWLETVRASVSSTQMNRWNPILVSEPDEYVFARCRIGQVDLIMVDGLSELRVECVRLSTAGKLPRCIVVDDSWRHEYAAIPDLLGTLERTELRGFGPGRIGVTQTDVYVQTAISF
jgi:hypothetical protein